MIISIDGEQIDVLEGISGHELAKQILGSAEKKVVAIKFNGKLQDLFLPIPESGDVEFVMLESNDGQKILRHTAAHILAHAVQSVYPTAKLTIGPATDEGFFYDIDFKTQIGAADLEKIEQEMKKIVKAGFRIERKEISRKEAIQMAKNDDEPYKLELIDAIPSGEKITIYTQGEWYDICRGPHLRSTSMVKAFKLTKLAGAYWHGDEKNKMLTRIYGVAFDSKQKLDEYFVRLEEAEKRDHRKLGKELDLFFLSDFAPGMPFFMPKGQVVINELTEFWREEHRKAGYVEISTPIALNRRLWEKSGHWDHYRKNMYTFDVENETTFAIKPMNCPGGMLFYKERLHSYREFPLRVGELGKVHRHEASGTLRGLFRVRCFTQDDAHIFMTPDQIEDEVARIISLIDEMYRVFGLEYSLELSTMPDDHIGSVAEWEYAEKCLKNALARIGKKFVVNAGDGAFYGPKIDVHIKDAIGRTWQCGTIQLDMQLPKRFELEYVDADGALKEPIMIHRVVLGSIERFFGIIIEHFAGAFPLWLSPVQAIVIPVSEKSGEYAQQVADKLKEQGIRTEIDLRAEKMGYKIRAAQLQKIPYMVIVGENEAATETISVRKRGNIEEKGLKLDEFVLRLKKQIANKSLEIE